MVGVPTGRLSPQIPPPQWLVTPVALEIDRGIGISLDGEALIVGQDARPGRIRILGHLEDGTFPQRDFTVERDGSNTRVDGYYDWQDYHLADEGGILRIQGSEPGSSSVVRTEGGRTVVENPYPARRYTIAPGAEGTRVDCGWDGFDFEVTSQGNTTRVQGTLPERGYTLTRHEDGSLTVDGHYAFQDFTIRPTERGFVVQGYYPQQRYEVIYE
jgi:hypothetical protein